MLTRAVGPLILLPMKFRTTLVRLLRMLVASIGLLLSGLPYALCATDELARPVTLHYIHRPPYMMMAGDTLTGLTGAPSFKAFQKAGVPFELSETPFARQLHMLQTNTGMDCMIGMFKKPERLPFAKFTKPIFRDGTSVILTTPSLGPRMAAMGSIEDLLGSPDLVFLVKLGYSYGVAMDALIEKKRPTTHKTTEGNLQMVKSIHLGMADYMVISPVEATKTIAAAGLAQSDFKQVRFKDMPAGEYRHIMCSKNVPDSTIAKLNAVIRSPR